VLREKALREKALLQHEDAQEKHEGKLQLSKPRVHLSMSRRLNASSVLNRTSRRNGGGWYKRVASWSELISVNQQPARSESTIGQSPGWSPGRRLGGGSDGLKRSDCAIRACAEITIYIVSRQRLLMTAGTLPLLMTAALTPFSQVRGERARVWPFLAEPRQPRAGQWRFREQRPRLGAGRAKQRSAAGTFT
jgi:hypothetical protein